ncbi:hypothetical protein MJI46_27530, partial [Salmonella enterica subsp. enterica serovar Cerro]|nr:hypothetical protein [Salmonella enterica subsp. enterica serovar Cerro]
GLFSMKWDFACPKTSNYLTSRRLKYLRRYDQLTPRVARCSTPSALKASFSADGVCYGRRGGGA